MSSMSSLTTALSALYAQRKGLDTTGHNIANANTEGYTRQRVQMVAHSTHVVGVWARWNGTGQGVDVTGTQRLNDAFLDLRSNQEHSLQGQLGVTQQVLSRIELGFGEPSELGLAAQLNDYWGSWDDVANHPTDMAARSALLERANTVSTNLRGSATALEDLRGDLIDQTKAKIGFVNQTAQSIAKLNDDIVNANNSGLSPNDLMDQRDLLVGRLADVLGVTVKPGDGGTVNVFVGGTALVRGTTTDALHVATVGDPATMEIQWTKDNYPAEVAGGEIAGLLGGVNSIIPSHLAQLDDVANRLMALTNHVHAQGADLNGAPGGILFSGSGARNISVAISDAKLVAAGTPGNGTADGSNALALAALAGHKADPLAAPPFDADGPDRVYRNMIVALGVQADAVNRRVDIQSAITRQVDAARDAQAGVNIDEEMTNLLSYQRAYEAAARYLTTIDQTLDRLINATGLVGR